jgi:hypothetical protein
LQTQETSLLSVAGPAGILSAQAFLLYAQSTPIATNPAFLGVVFFILKTEYHNL